MNDREKLIKVIENWHTELSCEYLADYILANGFCSKAEAYKEFADKVKQEINKIRENAPSRHIGVVINYLLCLQQKINDLLKELAGGGNE